MEKEKFLQSIRETLEVAGFSVDDFVNFCHKQESQGREKKFAFEVMYEGMVRSWVPLEGKQPLGVIFENHLITLHDSPWKMRWKHALGYCQEIKIEGHACSAGTIVFWRKLLSLSEQKKKMLDDLLVSLGGDVLDGKKFWSLSDSRDVREWSCACDDWSRLNMTNNRYARPVLDLSKLSL